MAQLLRAAPPRPHVSGPIIAHLLPYSIANVYKTIVTSGTSLSVPITNTPFSGQLFYAIIYLNYSTLTNDPLGVTAGGTVPSDNSANSWSFAFNQGLGSVGLSPPGHVGPQATDWMGTYWKILGGNETSVTFHWGISTNLVSATAWIYECRGFLGPPQLNFGFNINVQNGTTVNPSGTNLSFNSVSRVPQLIFSPLLADGTLQATINGAASNYIVGPASGTVTFTGPFDLLDGATRLITGVTTDPSTSGNTSVTWTWQNSLNAVTECDAFYDPAGNYTHPQCQQTTIGSGSTTPTVSTTITAPRMGQLLIAAVETVGTTTTLDPGIYVQDNSVGTPSSSKVNCSQAVDPAAAGSGTSYSVTITAPTAGDLIFTSIIVQKSTNSNPSITVPSGFTQIDNQVTVPSSTVFGWMMMAYKVSAGNETVITWNWTGATNGVQAAARVFTNWVGTPTLDLHGTTTGSAVTAITCNPSSGAGTKLFSPNEVIVSSIGSTDSGGFGTESTPITRWGPGGELMIFSTSGNYRMGYHVNATDYSNSGGSNNNWNWQWTTSSHVGALGATFYDSGQISPAWKCLASSGNFTASSPNRYGFFFWKIANGTETSVTANWRTGGTFTGSCIEVNEYDGFVGIPTLDLVYDTLTTSTVISLRDPSSGTAGSLTVSPELIICTVAMGGTSGTLTASGCFFDDTTGTVSNEFTLGGSPFNDASGSSLIISGWGYIGNQSSNAWNMKWTTSHSATISGASFYDYVERSPRAYQAIERAKTRREPPPPHLPKLLTAPGVAILAIGNIGRKGQIQPHTRLPFTIPPSPVSAPNVPAIGSPARRGHALPHFRLLPPFTPFTPPITYTIPVFTPPRRGKVVPHAHLQVQPLSYPAAITANITALGSPPRRGKTIPHDRHLNEIVPSPVQPARLLAIGSPPRHGKVLPHTRLQSPYPAAGIVVTSRLAIGSPPRRGKILPHIRLQSIYPTAPVTAISYLTTIGSPPRRGKVIAHTRLQTIYPPGPITVVAKLALGSPPRRPKVIPHTRLQTIHPPSVFVPRVFVPPPRVRRPRLYGVHPQVPEVFTTPVTVHSVTALTHLPRHGKLLPHTRLQSIYPFHPTPPPILYADQPTPRRRLVYLRRHPTSGQYNQFTVFIPPPSFIGGDVIFQLFKNLTGWIVEDESTGWSTLPNTLGWYEQTDTQ